MEGTESIPESFSEFYSEVKEIEKQDSDLTSDKQIERLLRKGSSYFNLNPFEVLQVDPDSSVDEIKKKYRRLSILVHPDKNKDNVERAQAAFDVINHAWKTLEDDDSRERVLAVIAEAKERTDYMLEQKREQMRKVQKVSVVQIEEDDPAKYKKAVYVQTMKLLADLERKRRVLEDKAMEERKRKREEELEAEEKRKLEKEFLKNFEESREGRVTSWKSFQSGSGSSGHKAKKLKKEFRPPKHKAESR